VLKELIYKNKCKQTYLNTAVEDDQTLA